jgi:hypothetical protein
VRDDGSTWLRVVAAGLVKELELLLDWSLCPSGLGTGMVLDALAFAARRTMSSCTKETAPVAWMPVLAFAEQEIQR